MFVKFRYHQVLWTYDDNIAEVGACNFFFVMKNDNGQKELVTPYLDGAILPGITRKSIIEFCQKDIDEKGADKAIVSKVTERLVKISEFIQMIDDGKIVECFGSGTAVTIIPVQKICNFFVNSYLKI